MTLLIIMAVMLAVVVGLLLLPLLRPTKSSVARAAYDLAIYRDQLAEVDQDVAREWLAADQADAARTEIHRRVLAADKASPKLVTKQDFRRSRFVAAFFIALVIPSGAWVTYSYLGSPEVPAQPFADRDVVSHFIELEYK